MKKLKTSEEYLKETFGWNHETSDLTHYVSYWKDLLKQVQLDMLEYAINRAVENADTELTPTCIRINKSSILKTIDEIKEELK